mgnify:CR=1 FL=1
MRVRMRMCGIVQGYVFVGTLILIPHPCNEPWLSVVTAFPTPHPRATGRLAKFWASLLAVVFPHDANTSHTTRHRLAGQNNILHHQTSTAAPIAHGLSILMATSRASQLGFGWSHLLGVIHNLYYKQCRCHQLVLRECVCVRRCRQLWYRGSMCAAT